MKFIKWFNILGTVFLLAALTACGTSEEKPAKMVNGTKTVNATPSNQKDQQEDPESKLSGALTTNTKDGKLSYAFNVKNEGNSEAKMTFNSGQKFEYTLKDATGTVMYTYSMDKLFAQSISETIIPPGESLDMDVDVFEGLNNLKPGTYTFEIFLTAEDHEDIKAETELNWGGEGEGLEEQAGSVKTSTSIDKAYPQTVIFVGLIDNNSIEVLENGSPVPYRLSEEVKETASQLKKNDKIVVHYVTTETGQKEIHKIDKQ